MRIVPRFLWSSFGVLSTIFMLSPLVLVIFFSFGNNPHATLPVGGLTTGWYRVLLENADFWRALNNSLIVTLSVGALSTVIGTLAAAALARWPMRAASSAMTVLAMPVMLPPLVLALALATAYSAAGLHLSVFTVIPSHLVFTQPFVILIVYAQMANFDHSVVESARDLGASRLRAFFTVVLPVIRPTIIGAALIAMAVSLDDFVITFFTIGGGMTLPTLVWGMLRTAIDPSINALGTLIIVATIGSSAIALHLTRYRG
jgi:spermidine/putrescine transport system permease protein